MLVPSQIIAGYDVPSVFEPGLHRQEVSFTVARVAALPGSWTVDVVGDGPLSLVLQPQEGDRFAPSFLVERVPGLVVVTGHRWDIVGAVGIYPNIIGAMNAIARLVENRVAAGSARLN